MNEFNHRWRFILFFIQKRMFCHIFSANLSLKPFQQSLLLNHSDLHANFQSNDEFARFKTSCTNFLDRRLFD